MPGYFTMQSLNPELHWGNCNYYLKGNGFDNPFVILGDKHNVDQLNYWRIPVLRDQIGMTKIRNVAFDFSSLSISNLETANIYHLDMDNRDFGYPKTTFEPVNVCKSSEAVEQWSSNTTEVFIWNTKYFYKLEIEASGLYLTTNSSYNSTDSIARSFSNGQTTIPIQTLCKPMTCTAPAFKYIRCSGIESRGTITVQFTADEVTIYPDGKEDIRQINGTYSTTTSFDLAFLDEDITPTME